MESDEHTSAAPEPSGEGPEPTARSHEKGEIEDQPDGMRQERRKSEPNVKAAVITALATIGAALIAAGAVLLGGADSDTGTGAGVLGTTARPTTTRADPVSSTSRDCEVPFEITAPPDNSPLPASNGVVVSGSACDGSLVWLLDYDPHDDSYYQVNAAPLEVADGRWEFLNSPIGDESDGAETVYTIVAMNVSQVCSYALQTAEPDAEGAVRFKPLPSVCPNGAAELKDVVTHVRVKRTP
jgi:hypothetical protein